MFGKAYIVNSLGISQLMYKTSVLPFLDPEYIQQIKKTCFIELKFKALKWSKFLVNKDCVLNHIEDIYLARFQVDINYIFTLS